MSVYLEVLTFNRGHIQMQFTPAHSAKCECSQMVKAHSHKPSRLPCYVFCICLSTNKDQKYKSVELGDQLWVQALVDQQMRVQQSRKVKHTLVCLSEKFPSEIRRTHQSALNKNIFNQISFQTANGVDSLLSDIIEGKHKYSL